MHKRSRQALACKTVLRGKCDRAFEQTNRWIARFQSRSSMRVSDERVMWGERGSSGKGIVRDGAFLQDARS